MNALNSILTPIADILLAPFGRLPSQVALIFWSVVVGIAMAWVFKHTSNQQRLKEVASCIKAQLLAIKLFKDDLGVTFRCQRELMKATGFRLLHSMPPMLIMLIPIALILTHLAVRYEFRPIQPNESSVVELTLSSTHWEANKDLQLQVPPQVEIETPALRDHERHTVSWRIRPTAPSATPLTWTIAGQTVEKALVVSDRPDLLHRVSPQRPGSNIFDRILYPTESGFTSDSPVQSISIQHPRNSSPIFGLDIPWWATFFIVSMLAAVATRPWLKVQF